jgi:hypothetical protein
MSQSECRDDMRKFQRFLTFFKIKSGEERLVGLLFLLALMLELAFVLIKSMAFGVFLAEYGPQSLPYSYIFVAIFASLTAILYIKLSERVSFSRMLIFNLLFLAIISLLVWWGLNTSLSFYVVFAVPLGLYPHLVVDEQSITIPRGGCMLLSSDGPIDTRNAEGVRFGEQGLKDLIRHIGVHVPAQSICQAVHDRLLEYQNGAPQFDDITLLAARRLD